MKNFRFDRLGKINLKKLDAGDTSACADGKKAAEKEFEKLIRKIDELQELFYADRRHKMLIVLQGMDTAGKDGAIRHVFRGVNPQGVKVASFKKPAQIESDHDFLWRIHRQTPGRGEIMIFNRSHYEDVLVVRVHDLVPEKIWRKRYEHINNFEKMLADEGTVILKFFLHIDNAEQKKRLESRKDDPDKHWKISPSDLPERALWDKYTEAYEDAIGNTSTKWAPWYVVPSNSKWHRNYVISKVLVETLKSLGMKYPEPQVDVSKLVIK
jgi:PPK2 family polyphosphate:nucleotide phosphotransferase